MPYKDPLKAREAARRAVAKYRATPHGSARIVAYNHSDRGKEVRKGINARARAGRKKYKKTRGYLANALRDRLSKAIKGNAKSGSAVRDLGCSIPELKRYLESKFLPGMSWENHGIDGWHIDHIKPLAKFDLTDRNQLLEACHYTNLQPLWAKDNLAKRDSIEVD